MMQHLLDALPRTEFEVAVLSFGIGGDHQDGEYYEYDGIPVFVGFGVPFPPDIIITHHGFAARVVQDICQEWPDARVVSVYHNDRYNIPEIQDLKAELEVFNTEWVKDSINHDSDSLTVHPPLDYDRHRVETTGGAVTLVNLQENKGVHLFARLANRFPDVPFLGVMGTHGTQEPILAPNALIHPVTQDMREVWRQTRVVLMPSEYESYGMVAAEACVNGIPVIANPTPGLVECLDYAGIFVPRDDTDGYERVLRLLLTDPEKYREHSKLAELRGLELRSQTEIELSRFVERMRGLV